MRKGTVFTDLLIIDEEEEGVVSSELGMDEGTSRAEAENIEY